MVDNLCCKGKGKAISILAWTDPDNSRRLKLPDFKKKAQDGVKVVSPRHRPPLPPENTPGTHFCWETAVGQWLRCCATNLKVACSIPDVVIENFH